MVIKSIRPQLLTDIYNIATTPSDNNVTLGGTEMSKKQALALTCERLFLVAIYGGSSIVYGKPIPITLMLITSIPTMMLVLGSTFIYVGTAYLAHSIAVGVFSSFAAFRTFELGAILVLLGYIMTQAYSREPSKGFLERHIAKYFAPE